MLIVVHVHARNICQKKKLEKRHIEQQQKLLRCQQQSNREYECEEMIFNWNWNPSTIYQVSIEKLCIVGLCTRNFYRDKNEMTVIFQIGLCSHTHKHTSTHRKSEINKIKIFEFISFIFIKQNVFSWQCCPYKDCCHPLTINFKT